jgi:hypothetical protein
MQEEKGTRRRWRGAQGRVEKGRGGVMREGVRDN